MREIKFRAWVAESKFFQSIHVPYMAIQGNPDLETLSSFMHHYSDEPILMQYTGLKDKNGKEIYEGDIIEGKEGIFTIENWGDGVYRVVSYGMTWEWLHQLQSKGYLQHGNGNYEVIGNIYENPELVNP